MNSLYVSPIFLYHKKSISFKKSHEHSRLISANISTHEFYLNKLFFLLITLKISIYYLYHTHPVSVLQINHTSTISYKKGLSQQAFFIKTT